MIRKVSFAEAKQLLDTLPEKVLLDVREEEEYITGHAVDAVLLPTASGPAFRAGSFADDPNALYRSDRFTTIANLTGCPAVQLPGGGDGTMPVGISLMGRKRSEGALIRLAAALERELEDDVRKETGRGGGDSARYVHGIGGRR